VDRTGETATSVAEVNISVSISITLHAVAALTVGNTLLNAALETKSYEDRPCLSHYKLCNSTIPKIPFVWVPPAYVNWTLCGACYLECQKSRTWPTTVEVPWLNTTLSCDYREPTWPIDINGIGAN